MMEIEDISSELGCILPGDVMFEILSRLPVKPLVKFRCVKKAWYSLIKNPMFVKTHSLKLKDYNLIASNIVKYSTGKMQSELSTIRLSSCKLEQLGLSELGIVTIVGTYDGLVCLTYLDERFGVRFKVMNPVLGEYRDVYKSKGLTDCISMGFGCDKKTGDFKILRVEWVLGYPEVNLYSLCSNSWKRIQSSKYLAFKTSICEAAIGNCLYWLSSSRNGKNVITGFDLSSETFHEIPMPQPKSRNMNCLHIAAWSHKLLAAFLSKHENHEYDIWTVSPDQILINNDSWTFQETFDFNQRCRNKIKTPGLQIHYWPKNGWKYRVHLEPIYVFPESLLKARVQVHYYRESFVPIMNARKSQRKPVRVRKQFRICKVLEGFLYIVYLLVYFGKKIFQGMRISRNHN